MSLRRIGVALFGVLLISILVWFVYAAALAWRFQGEAALSCGSLPSDSPHSYIQYSIKEQAAEPYFRGSFFINLGEVTSPAKAQVQITAGHSYGDSLAHIDFINDEQNKTFRMQKESDEIPFVRTSGSARNFPFDSASIDFDTTFTPPLTLRGVILRNFNPSFSVPCDRVTMAAVSPDKLHLHFEMRRKPLVQLMAIVILLAGTLFVLIIPFSVKWEDLPTSVASFFFSVWSTRGILSSEMMVFPTLFDMAILSLCVLLMLLIGIRVLIRWVRPGQRIAN
ncbi:MAG: hypothetical protein JWQ87_1798 [Candidatus Sulfotelmatobacter sp.]|nr:hypothetical protein [Candidatus Sulfotelmatobacter sp.]